MTMLWTCQTSKDPQRPGHPALYSNSIYLYYTKIRKKNNKVFLNTTKIIEKLNSIKQIIHTFGNQYKTPSKICKTKKIINQIDMYQTKTLKTQIQNTYKAYKTNIAKLHLKTKNYKK